MTANGGTSDITFNNATNDFGTAVFSGANVTLQDATGLVIGTSSATGTLTVTANGGITQSGPITGNSAATFNAVLTTNDITLGNTSNNFGSVGILAGRNATVRDTNALVLSASTVSGTYDVAANGSITTSGNLALNGTTSTIYANGSTSDLTLSNTITHSGGAASLDLRADNDLGFTATGNVTSLVGALNVTLNSNRDASGSGGISVLTGARIVSNGGDIVMGGGATPATTDAIGSNANPVFADGVALYAVTVDAGAGNITAHGIGRGVGGGAGVFIAGANITTTTGNITLAGNGGGPTFARGVLIQDGGAITSAGGAITITGNSSPGSTGFENGVWFGNTGAAMQVTNSGAGTITITGTTQGSTANLAGVLISNPGTVIQSQNGAIRITGTANGAAGDGIRFDGAANIVATGTAIVEFTGTGSSAGRDITAGTAASGTVNIGGTGAGNILFRGTSRGIDLGSSTLAAAVQAASASNVSLNSANGVSQANGSITAGGLRVLGSGAFILNQATNNVSALAGNVTGATSSLSYTDTNGFQIGTVTAAEVAGGNATTTTGLIVGAAGNVGNTITLLANGAVDQATGAFIVTDGLRLTGGSAASFNFPLLSNDIATLAANTSAAAGTVLRYTDANNFSVGTVNGVAGINAGTADVSLGTQAGGMLSQANSIVANGFAVTGTGNFSLTNGSNDVAVLAVSANGGNSLYTDAGSFNIGTVDGVSGISVGSANNMTLSTTGTVQQSTAADNITGGSYETGASARPGTSRAAGRPTRGGRAGHRRPRSRCTGTPSTTRSRAP
jgi:hypothetical protein